MSRPKQCKSLTLERKVALIKEVEKAGRSKSCIAKEFGIPLSTLSTVLKNKQKDLEGIEQSFSSKCKRIRASKFPDVEAALGLFDFPCSGSQTAARGLRRAARGCRHSIIIIVTLAQRALCRLLHLRPVDTAASADEFVWLLQAIVELLHAYDVIEEESGDVEHHTISLLLARLMSVLPAQNRSGRRASPRAARWLPEREKRTRLRQRSGKWAELQRCRRAAREKRTSGRLSGSPLAAVWQPERIIEEAH
ncbi:hypothetical protein HPB52_007036 [Rhipicephalus sanguineus]|uniref:HTH psq-type domain-containing protein n=1 Tax=Rhipicephalus sanguineus TaxID=34632 RepID=A0A9D4Q5A5_RHISA|nr:hypothetical protein HPB52_007036 [Rhipicephalus sanguineus]